ncbi:MAG TPA: L-histidine N(alpha)-methyltransferase [Polyangiaceae bacterium]|jgi:dimethylhistidine N-methyltransferase
MTRSEADVLGGLHASRKWLPCRLFYDARGAALFEEICKLPEYYLTRNELALLEAELPSIARHVGPEACVIEPGSGAGKKTRMLLGALERPASYVPIDVSREQLEENARALRAEFPGLSVAPVHGDYMQPIAIPHTKARGRTLVFFPGSTIGNFEPDEAREFLARFGEIAGPGATLLLGADSNADGRALVAAYDDARGVTAAFDLNALAHVNRAYGADFDLDAFKHRAFWNPERSRIEMHLVSQRRQTVHVAGEAIAFERGEPIVTEHCYKHSPDALARILADAGFAVRRTMADPERRMHLWLAEQKPT